MSTIKYSKECIYIANIIYRCYLGDIVSKYFVDKMTAQELCRGAARFLYLLWFWFYEKITIFWSYRIIN